MNAIRLMVGLGNPGPEHERDRHNAGFWLVDALAAAHHAIWRHESRFHGALTRITVNQHDVWLLKPLTYMNGSGRAVAAVAQFYRIAPPDILVVHDELDLDPGMVRLKRGGGSGGHNGLKDISAALNSPDYARLRIGIGHPRQHAPGRLVADFVLHRPSLAEQSLINRRLDDVQAMLPTLIQGPWERAMQALHAPQSSA